MPPLVVDVINGFKADLMRKEAQQMQSMARRWQQVEASLQDRVEVFASRVAQDGLTPSQIQSRQFQLDRYNSLLRQVTRELDKYTDYADGLITTGQRQAAQLGIQAASSAIRAVAGARTAFDILPIDAIENMGGLAGDGSPLRTLLQASYSSGAQGMLDQLIRSTALGVNPQVTARNMVRLGLSQSLSRMMTIARTEQLRVHRESSRQQYQQSGVVENYRRLATRDNRTCMACLMADGETYELTESLKEHPNGRCLVKGSLVYTDRGLVPIERVKVGDFVLTHMGQYKRVISTAKRYYSGNVITLCKDGYSVTVTPDHRVYTGLDWIEAKAATTFWTLNDVLLRASNLSTVHSQDVKNSSFFLSAFAFLPVLCHLGSSSTANFASTNAKSILNTSTAYSLSGYSDASFSDFSNSSSLSLEVLRQLACRVKAAFLFASGLSRSDKNLSNASGSLSFWRLAASLAEIGVMLNRRMSRINDLVLILASAVSSRYVAPSSTYRRRNHDSTGSPNCSDNLSIHADVDIDVLSCIDFFKPNALARWWTDFFVRPSNMLAISSAFIDQKLLRITSSSWAVHNFPDMGTIVHQPCKIAQEYSGMVYDLTVEEDQSFIAGGVVVHNCTLTPTVTGFAPVQWQKGPDWFMQQSPETQRKMLGNGRYNAWKDGRFDLDQLVQHRNNATWGDSLQVTPLRDLLNGNVQPYRVRQPEPDPAIPASVRIAPDESELIRVRQ